MIVARRDDTAEDYYGTRVADPYRYMENPDDPATRKWSEAQAAAAQAFLQALPGREALLNRLTALYDYPKYSAPRHKGDRYFFSKNDGLQNQAVLYYRDSLSDSPAPASAIVLDPNTLSADGTAALSTVAYSDDGTLLAYGVSRSGSDWQEVRVRDVAAGRDFPEILAWCKFTSVAWLPRTAEAEAATVDAGFFYNRLPEPGTVPAGDEALYSRVCWHTLGMPQERDVLVYERPDAKELRFSPHVTDDGRYLILYVSHGTATQNRIYYRELDDTEREGGPSAFVRLLDAEDANYRPIDNDGHVLSFRTDLDAPRGRIIAIDLTRPARDDWREIVPESADVMDFVIAAGGELVVGYLHDAHHRLVRYTKTGEMIGEIALPALGTVTEIHAERDDMEMFLAFTAFLSPTAVHRFDFTTGALTPLFAPQVDFPLAEYETTQVFYLSKDGTRVPMFLTHKRGLMLDGTNPTLLYGYGGFDISVTPAFAPTRLPWLEAGGVYAVANLRGGGEYGEEWHAAGKRERKQNVFDDFIAAAEWLIAHRYTTPQRLAIEGRSNGGLLTAACLLQRPDLFGAVHCGVPVTDMLRFQRFTAGRFWTVEYGDAEAAEEDFRFLIAYSPLHTVREGGTYPATLITTADTDDRVVPMHAKKFAATLQHAQSGDNPILLRIETKAGHGAGKPTAKVLEEQADIYAFLFARLGITPPTA